LLEQTLLHFGFVLKVAQLQAQPGLAAGFSAVLKSVAIAGTQLWTFWVVFLVVQLHGLTDGIWACKGNPWLCLALASSLSKLPTEQLSQQKFGSFT